MANHPKVTICLNCIEALNSKTVHVPWKPGRCIVVPAGPSNPDTILGLPVVPIADGPKTVNTAGLISMLKMLKGYEEAEAIAVRNELRAPDWSSRLAEQFGEHPPRIFHEGA